ncbi:MAG TPA: alanine--tRNA ligase [Candidatus Dojkabacteria bacterium]|nr:alanine--tRNA ligase [Candidatus Dojkabacteria bacterium]
MKYEEVREKYLRFFETKGHSVIPSAPLVPEDDPSVLFVNAGMFPLIPFLKGEKHPKGTRLVNTQRCLRTGDIDDVGDPFHCTTFLMLGNWSLNDYFKEEAINMTMEFLVKELSLSPQNIYATVFGGEDQIPQDSESIAIWKKTFEKYGIKAKVGDRIQKYGKDKNWWGLESGGPCGPDSEIFYDTGKEKCSNKCNVNCSCGKYVEIGNNVFMEYLKENNTLKPLGRHNVDFGGGLERITALLQGKNSVYETDIYKPILDEVIKISKKQNIKSQRIIVDHIKSATWLIMDGVYPSRTQQGYILRRLIRRAIRHARSLGIEGEFTQEIGEISIKQFKNIMPNLETQQEEILKTLEQEEKNFNKTLSSGLTVLEKLIKRNNTITGKDAFLLYETYGLPLELTQEILQEKGLSVTNIQEFNTAEKQHQEKSRTASKGLFKGGLADTSQMSTKYHTASHLLLASLRKILGEHIYQKGSNITPERLRLDFPNDQKLTDEQILQVEQMVNNQISKQLPVQYEEMPKEQALKIVPYAAFPEKYPDIVKVYYIGSKDNPFSIEICNGPHVSNTKQLGKFKIIKQENVGAGIKRIKAVLQ